MEENNMQIIKRKLNQFRRKYYLNKIIRGSILLALLFTSLLVLFAATEGALWLSTGWRTALFYVLALSSLGVLAGMIIYPLTKYLNVGPTMTDAEAARLIGKHFSEVDDKLLNLLQLHQLDSADNSLLLAAISQRIQHLQPVPFASAINFKPNWKLARYLAVPALAALLLFLFNPETITKGTERLFNFDKHYEKPAPYNIILKNHANKMITGESHTVNIEIEGDELPAKLFMYIKDANDQDFNKHMLEKEGAAKYSFTFKSVNADFEYKIANELYNTGVFQTRVLKRPSMGAFNVTVTPPAYTGLPVETLSTNAGDLTAIYGSTITWQFNFKGPVQSAEFVVGDSIVRPIKNLDAEAKTATYVMQALQDFDYAVRLRSDEDVPNIDTVRYAADIYEDKYPAVTIVAPGYESDLPNNGIVNLACDLSDDFGFSRATLFYRYLKSDAVGKVSEQYKTAPLNVQRGRNFFTLQQAVDFFELGADEGDQLEYYVKVWDNDVISGPKAATSISHKINYLSIDSQYEAANDKGDKFEEDAEAAKKEAEQSLDRLKKLDEKLLDKKNPSYEDRKELEETAKQQQKAIQKMEEAAEKMKEQIEQSEDNSLYTEETMRKMEQLQKLIDEMANSEMKDELEKMLEEMQNMDRREMKQKMDQMKRDAESMEENMDRALELFKQLKVDLKTQELMQKLDNLAEQQDQLKKTTEDAKTKEQLQKTAEKQKELNEKMENLQKDLQDLKEMKEDTKTPNAEEMKDLEQDGEEAQQEMQNAEQQMQDAQQQAGDQSKKGQKQMQQSKQGAQKSQQKSKEKMEEMRDQLEQMQQKNEMEQQTENYEDLRNLLENLVKLSFDQEDLRDQIALTRANDPRMVALVQKQNKVKDDMEMIEDSLIALSKRALEIKKYITDELDEVNLSMTRAVEFLDDNKNPSANTEQHKIMTGLNNLANMLVQSLDQMQQQMMMMSGMGKGCKMPKNPGNSMNMRQMAEMQQMLNQQMQNAMQNGEKGKKQMEEFAKKQGELRKKVDAMFKKLAEEGEKGLGAGGKISSDMKMTEEQLEERAEITKKMMERQRQIEMRMLEYDKAMRQREFDNKRKSKTGQDIERKSPAELEAAELLERIRRENYKKDKYEYAPMYQKLIDEYYKLLNEQKTQ